MEGGCECGNIRYRITGEALVVYACHCTICQTQSGSAFAMAMRLPSAQFQLLKGELKRFERFADSGQKFVNSFCPDCGTRIYHQPEWVPEHISLKPGTLDDTSGLRPTHHVFADSAQPWVIMPPNADICETSPTNRDWLSGKKT